MVRDSVHPLLLLELPPVDLVQDLFCLFVLVVYPLQQRLNLAVDILFRRHLKF